MPPIRQAAPDSGKYPLKIPDPKALEAMRARLFALDEEVVLNAEDFELFWPYCENIWSYHRKNVLQHGIVSTRYFCRLCRAGTPASKKEGVKHRNRAVREKICNTWMTITTYLDGYRVLRRNQHPHAHDLAASDDASKNKMLRDYEVRIQFGEVQAQLNRAFFDLLRKNRVLHYRNHHRAQREMFRWIEDVQAAIAPSIQHARNSAQAPNSDDAFAALSNDADAEEHEQQSGADQFQPSLEDMDLPHDDHGPTDQRNISPG